MSAIFSVIGIIIIVAIVIPLAFITMIFLIAAVRVALGMDRLSKIEKRRLQTKGPDDIAAMGESVSIVLKKIDGKNKTII